MEGHFLGIPTVLGPLRLEYSPRGLRGIGLGQAAPTGAESTTPPFLARLIADLQRYAAGQRVEFDVPLDLNVGTNFQRRIWEQLRRIPYGQTRSYAWLAQQVGQPRAVRAAGGACGANPVPIVIPCHRILRANGRLGGFSAGLDWKERLLALEGRLTGPVFPLPRAGAARPGTGSTR